MGIENLSERAIGSLSDGECQKVMIAKALAQQTRIILLDEPTAFLDYPSKVETMTLMKELVSEGKEKEGGSVENDSCYGTAALMSCSPISRLPMANDFVTRTSLWHSRRVARLSHCREVKGVNFFFHLLHKK